MGDCMKGKKGLIAGIIVAIIFLFLFGVMSLFAKTGWNYFNDAVQNASNETINEVSKAKVDSLSVYMSWPDKLFVVLFMVLMISYLISSVTLPVDRPIYLFIVIVLLFIVTAIAMVLSNSWLYIIENPTLSEAAQDMTVTTFLLRFFPIITFFILIIGAALFFTRKKSSVVSGGNIDFQ